MAATVAALLRCDLGSGAAVPGLNPPRFQLPVAAATPSGLVHDSGFWLILEVEGLFPENSELETFYFIEKRFNLEIEDPVLEVTSGKRKMMVLVAGPCVRA